jgi:hypothetical protein
MVVRNRHCHVTLLRADDHAKNHILLQYVVGGERFIATLEHVDVRQRHSVE